MIHCRSGALSRARSEGATPFGLAVILELEEALTSVFSRWRGEGPTTVARHRGGSGASRRFSVMGIEPIFWCSVTHR
jgi:hypothetical protein